MVWIVLAALSSSRSLVVGRSVGRSVRNVCEKVTLQYCKVIKTYLPTYLWDSSDSSDICDSYDSCDSSDRSDSSDSSDSSDNTFLTKILWLKFCD